jgi:hypothetical protein
MSQLVLKDHLIQVRNGHKLVLGDLWAIKSDCLHECGAGLRAIARTMDQSIGRTDVEAVRQGPI